MARKKGANAMFVTWGMFLFCYRNWYGFETELNQPQGLDVRTLDEIFSFLQEQKFNALRIPFSLKFAKNAQEPIRGNFRDSSLNGLTHFDFMDKVITTAAQHDILVMLDLHR